MENGLRKTGIFELDELLGGGFHDKSIVLLIGTPGTKFSVLLLQILIEWAKSLEKILWVALDESPNELKETARFFKWDLDNLEEQGKWRFLDVFATISVTESQILGLNLDLEPQSTFQGQSFASSPANEFPSPVL